MTKKHDFLTRLLQRLVDQYNPEARMEAKQLAEIAYTELDPHTETPLIFQPLVIIDLTRRFGALLVHNFDIEKRLDSSGQVEMFEKLQSHYPVKGVYIPRGQLSIEERRRISNRYRGQADEFIKHANALDAETDLLLRDNESA